MRSKSKKKIATIFIAGAFFALGVPVAFADYTITLGTVSNSFDGTFGDRTNAYAFNTSAAGNAGAVTVCLKNGGAVGDAIIAIEGDSGGSPDDSPIATFTIPSASVSGSGADVSGTFGGAALSASTQYWLVYTDSLGNSDIGQYYSCAESGNAYPLVMRNFGSWISGSYYTPRAFFNVITATPSTDFSGLKLFGSSTMAGAAGDLAASAKSSTANVFPLVIVVLGLIIAFYAIELMFTFFPPVPEKKEKRGRRSE